MTKEPKHSQCDQIRGEIEQFWLNILVSLQLSQCLENIRTSLNECLGQLSLQCISRFRIVLEKLLVTLVAKTLIALGVVISTMFVKGKNFPMSEANLTNYDFSVSLTRQQSIIRLYSHNLLSQSVYMVGHSNLLTRKLSLIRVHCHILRSQVERLHDWTQFFMRSSYCRFLETKCLFRDEIDFSMSLLQTSRCQILPFLPQP